MNFTLRGTRVLEGTAVEVKLDFRDVKVGDGRVEEGGAWTAEVRMPTAGRTPLVAE